MFEDTLFKIAKTNCIFINENSSTDIQCNVTQQSTDLFNNMCETRTQMHQERGRARSCTPQDFWNSGKGKVHRGQGLQRKKKSLTENTRSYFQ